METILLIAVVLLLGACVVGAVFGARLLRRQQESVQGLVADEREASIQALQEALDQALIQQRHETVQAVTADREAITARSIEATVQVANQKLEATVKQGATELDQRNKAFGQQVESLTTDFNQLKRAIASLQSGTEASSTQIREQLKAAQRDTKDLASTAQGLREALANTQIRGQWGERMAEDVLNAAGFVNDVNYRTQQKLSNGTKPDFTFNLPDGLVLHMDVKFPYANYIKFLEAKAPAEQDAARAAFAKDVRNHIKELPKRGYIDPESTVDYVLMFVPNESVYAFLHENDVEILDVALRQKVVLCSPSTLFAVLGVVRAAVDNFTHERASNDILNALQKFSKQWDKFGSQLDTVQNNLDRTTKSFEQLNGTRRRGIERELRRIDEIEVDAAQRPLLVDATQPALLDVSDPAV